MLGDRIKPSLPWGIIPYTLPKPYLRPRLVEKGEEEKKRAFVQGAGDGPAYSILKARRNSSIQVNKYGNEGRTSPHSYLPIRDWTNAKKSKGEGKKLLLDKSLKIERGTLFDLILRDSKKYNYPGPANYFKNKKKKSTPNTPKKEIKSNLSSRTNFISDVECLASEIPSPNQYKLKVCFCNIMRIGFVEFKGYFKG